jgi:predicted negative regulator of RcsB-dependent stress response|tara:strand:+ start:27318 stop:27491 length:174 start_codon:yes stop_codon:yes gene_type:complete
MNKAYSTIRQAGIAFEKGDTEKAKNLYSEALRHNPSEVGRDVINTGLRCCRLVEARA